MSTDIREVFPTLENPDGSGGAAATMVVPGQAASSVSGAVPALVVKDSSGNLQFFTLDGSGRLPVTTGTAGTPVRAVGELPSGFSSVTGAPVLVTGAQIVLGNSQMVSPLGFVFSCFRETHAQLVWTDNGVDNILCEGLCGPGQFTVSIDLEGDSFTTGATGVQNLELRARNTTATASSIRGTVIAVHS